jgi:hypothetical protein
MSSINGIRYIRPASEPGDPITDIEWHAIVRTDAGVVVVDVKRSTEYRIPGALEWEAQAPNGQSYGGRTRDKAVHNAVKYGAAVAA